VKLVAEQHPGVVTETELACIERDEDVGLADLGLRLDEAKRLTAALQAEAWLKKCHFQVTPKIDKALVVRGFLVLRVTLS